jgi:hypothetical protein
MSIYWDIQGTLARLSTGILAGEIDVAFPWRGFQPAASVREGIALFKVHTRAHALDEPETLVEYYQRGVDLVATYAQTVERNTRPQVYWRVIEHPLGDDTSAAALEVIVSSQTSLLESQPLTILESTLPPGEISVWNAQGTLLELKSGQWLSGDAAPCVVLFRPRDWSLSYCEMVQPADCSAVRVEDAHLPCVRWQLFPESLEKGVIRRGRVRGVYLPRDRDAELALAAFHEFVNSPPALST